MADERTKSGPITRRQLDVSLDRQALREVIAGLMKPGGTQEWCIACGAGKGTEILEKGEWVQRTGEQIFQGKSFKEFVDSLKDLGKQAWCIACGAGKDASPLDRLGDPASLTDEVIEIFASKVISTIKVG